MGSVIAERYSRLHPEVYVLEATRFLSVEFRDLVDALRGCEARPRAITNCIADLKDRGLLTELRPKLWSFSVFTPEFCDLLNAELNNFAASGLPKTAPNTMNRYGVILRELGFSKGLLDPFVLSWLDPVAQKLLPEFTDELDSYRAFTVQYDVERDGDVDLACHYDNS